MKSKWHWGGEHTGGPQTWLQRTLSLLTLSSTVPQESWKSPHSYVLQLPGIHGDVYTEYTRYSIYSIPGIHRDCRMTLGEWFWVKSVEQVAAVQIVPITTACLDPNKLALSLSCTNNLIQNLDDTLYYFAELQPGWEARCSTSLNTSRLWVIQIPVFV